MIGIGFAEFFSFLLMLTMLYIALLWFRENRRQRKNEWQLSNRKLFHCNTCHLSFIPKHPVSLCRCPRCNTVCIPRRDGNEPVVKNGRTK
ncbi:MAG: hypothetical protein IKD23_07245 [Lentisphaeria bacterium]|nr:hypothetical protein [Lentisphaerota bacterium]MBR2626172.1 hypothetical protein [Lentisphaeria bacterium]